MVSCERSIDPSVNAICSGLKPRRRCNDHQAEQCVACHQFAHHTRLRGKCAGPFMCGLGAIAASYLGTPAQGNLRFRLPAVARHLAGDGRARPLESGGYTGCGKTQFLKTSEKWIALGCPRNDSRGLVDGFVSPNFCPFAIHSEFFRSLYSRRTPTQHQLCLKQSPFH
jgi:hypothetical protein